MTAPASSLLSRVVDQYHRTFCERKDAQEYFAKRGLTDTDVLRAFKVGYADGSLLKAIPKNGDVKAELLSLGVVTKEGRELLGGCVVVPIPDPLSGEWTTLYGRGMRTPRHCYLTGPLRGVLNYQAARSASEVILTESVIDALSFHQVGVSTAIPIYGTNGFTADHLDLLKREGVRRVILALDGDAAGRRATVALKEKLASLGIGVRVMPYPSGVKDPNELLVSCNGNAQSVFAKMLHEAEPRTVAVVVPAAPVATVERRDPSGHVQGGSPQGDVGRAITREGDSLLLRRDGLVYAARVYAPLLGRLRATLKVERGTAFHVDTLDLYASRSRTEFTKRVAKALTVDAEAVERDLLALLVEAEKTATASEESADAACSPPPISDSDRAEALTFLRRPDLLDQAAKDVDALGFVGEDTNKRLLYLVAISRKLPDPLSAIVLSQSGAGKSGITEVIEKLTPPEDVVLFTRLTPQSLYYTEPGFLDQKLVIVEERYGSMEADYSIRVLQSRKKLIAAAPIKDPQTGNMRTKVFTVEARAAFIEATTASAVNHENATRCFELTMDESSEQTRRIHERQRLMRTERGLDLRREAEAITRCHWNAQRLLEPLPVVIPFADRLTFPSSWMRTRRDHARFLNLIEVSAFLHQHQRERRNGAILADVGDYAAAYALAASVLAETLSDVKKPLREAYERIRGLCGEGDGTISRREIREELAVPDSTVRRWLSDLVDFEYLAIANADGAKPGQGRMLRYRALDRAPRETEILGLLSPDELRERLR
jgi:DNA primase